MTTHPSPAAKEHHVPKKTEEQPEEQETFAAIIAAIDAPESEPSRHLSIQIDESLRDAIRSAQSSGQKASVTVTVKIQPGPERRISFAAAVKAALPRPPVAGVTLYADVEGNVHSSDPAQKRFTFTPPAEQSTSKKEN